MDLNDKQMLFRTLLKRNIQLETYKTLLFRPESLYVNTYAKSIKATFM